MNLRQVERSVLDGFVINKRGEWCSINEALEEEIYFMQHVESGEIIKDGKWVKIDDIFTGEAPTPATRRARDPEDSIKMTDTQKIVINAPPEKPGLKKSKKAARIAAPQPEPAPEPASPARSRIDRGEGFDAKVQTFEDNLARKESVATHPEPSEPPAPEGGEQTAPPADIQAAVRAPEGDTLKKLDEWDTARRRNYKVVIIPLAVLVIAAVILVLVLL